MTPLGVILLWDASYTPFLPLCQEDRRQRKRRERPHPVKAIDFLEHWKIQDDMGDNKQ